MIEKVGMIGVGHAASFLVEGFRKANREMEIILSPRNIERSKKMAAQFGAVVVNNNQAVVDSTDLVILSTRPSDTVKVAQNINFRSEQVVISIAAGVTLKSLIHVTLPATVVRAMPISCAAINQSPTLLYPDHSIARELFSSVGQVHTLQNETFFTRASVIAAFYAWIFELLNQTITWTAKTGISERQARNIVLETVYGAVNIALTQSDKDLTSILATLATSGGITEQGLNVLVQQHGFTAWIEALEAVHKRLSAI
ncbi:MAG: pyrroline-5-carboxylate reductase family protein [Candidatus Hodarchaeota archaeon]